MYQEQQVMQEAPIEVGRLSPTSNHMTYKLIKTDNYLLVVDDSEIKAGDWYLDGNDLKIWNGNLHSNRLTSKKIIAHLPLNNAPILEGVDLLPPIDDVEQLAELKYPIIMSPIGRNLAGGYYDVDLNYSERSAYKNGYNKAREKYKYTEEDVRKAFNAGLMNRYSRTGEAVAEKEFIQSLSQYPTEFECEMKYFEVDMGLGEECIEYGEIPQKITTDKGIQWVGKYK